VDRNCIKIMGRWGDREIGRNSRQKAEAESRGRKQRQKAIYKKRTRNTNTDTISRYDSIPSRFEQTARVTLPYRIF
jgi:hypothetical protein